MSRDGLQNDLDYFSTTLYQIFPRIITLNGKCPFLPPSLSLSFSFSKNTTITFYDRYDCKIVNQ